MQELITWNILTGWNIYNIQNSAFLAQRYKKIKQYKRYNNSTKANMYIIIYIMFGLNFKY